MSITLHQSASRNSFASNRSEYVVSSTLSDLPKFKYNFNVLYDATTITAVSSQQFEGGVKTKLTLVDNLFIVGDNLFIGDNFNVDVLSVDTTTNTIIVDTNTWLLDITPNTTTISKTLTYNINKNPENGLGVIDIKDTLRTFVSPELRDTNDLYFSKNPLFTYKMAIGSEYEFTFDFNGNDESGSLANFYNTTLPEAYTSSMPFEVGDSIVIENDLYEWEYDDYVFDAENMALSGSTPHYLTDATQIFVDDNPIASNNGYTTTEDGISGSYFRTSKSHTSGPVQAGKAYYQVAPTYNTVATITDITYSVSRGVVIHTDIPSVDVPNTSGTIKFSDGRVIKEWDITTDNKLATLGGMSNQQMLTLNQQEYHTDNDIYDTTLWSCLNTTLPSTYKHRVERDSKGFLLMKPSIKEDGSKELDHFFVYVWFYDKDNNYIGEVGWDDIIHRFDSGSGDDYYGVYVPLGLNQLSGSNKGYEIMNPGKTYDDIHTYEMYSEYSYEGENLYFEVNPDCGGGYDVYHIMWRDSFGSWMTMPFKYKSTNSVETDTKTYYQKQGTIVDNGVSHNTYDRGRTNIYKRYTDKIKLNSGWMTDEENILIKDMLTSPDVYIQNPDGELIATQILNKDLTLGKSQNDDIFKYEFEFAYSIDELKY